MTTDSRSNVRFPNPIPSLLVFLAVAVAAGTLTLAYFWLNPGAMGVANTNAIDDTAYRYSDLNLERPSLFVEMHDGWIIPLYRQGDVAGALMIGAGSYLVEPGAETQEILEREIGRKEVYDTLSAVYLPTTHQEFDNLVYEARAEKGRAPLALRQAQTYIDELQNTPTTVQAYGIRRDWYTNPNIVQLFGSSYGRVSYAATNTTTLTFLDMNGLQLNLNADDTPLSQPITSQTLDASPFLLLYLSLTLLLVFLVFVLTVDAVPNDRQDLIVRLRSSPERSGHRVELAGILLVGLLLEFAAMLGLVKEGLPDTAVGAWWLAAALLTAVYAWRTRVPLLLIGLARDNWFRAIVIGLLLGILGFASGTLMLPTGLRELEQSELVRQVVWAIVIMGYAREFFHRGLLQSYAQLLLGRMWGLLGTAVLFGLLYLGPRWVLHGRPVIADLLQGLVILPAYNFLLGFAYERTGNLHANALAAGLMVLLPRLLQF